MFVCLFGFAGGGNCAACPGKDVLPHWIALFCLCVYHSSLGPRLSVPVCDLLRRCSLPRTVIHSNSWHLQGHDWALHGHVSALSCWHRRLQSNCPRSPFVAAVLLPFLTLTLNSLASPTRSQRFMHAVLQRRDQQPRVSLVQPHVPAEDARRLR